MTTAAAKASHQKPPVRRREHPPRSLPRPGEMLVPRTRLVRGLMAARTAPLALVVAPAGYGKTTLLAQWDEHDERPFAWLPLEEAHNDPLRLMRGLAGALHDVTPLPDDLLAALDAEGPRAAALAQARMRGALRQGERAFVLVLDDAQWLEAPGALALLGALIEDLRPGSQLVLASRRHSKLPVARLRAHRKLIEVRQSDLVMTAPEAALLTRLSGLELDSEQLRGLVLRTEGWPAGLCLATLTAIEEADPVSALATFAGDDRHVADYLREEFLAGLRPAEVDFLTRSAILERLSGPLCDFVLERRDSARALKRLSRMNLLLEPLDRADRQYRLHRLFAEMLRGELRQREPEQERALHARASDWHARHGEPARAIDDAIAAADAARAGHLLWEHAPEYVSYGHNDKVRQWLARFSHEQIAGCPTLALTAATSHLAIGDRTRAEEWASAASNVQRRERTGVGADALEAPVALVRAVAASEGVARMGDDARRAFELEPDGGWWRALACLLAGVSAHLTGKRDHARAWLEEGARLGAAAAPSIQVLCLAQLALLAIERDDSPAAEMLAVRAKAQVERIGLREYPTSALVYAVSADVLARLGRVEESRRDSDDAGRLLTRLTDFAPWYEVEVRIAIARAALRLSDLPCARRLLSEASWCLQPVPGATVARAWLDACWAQVEEASDQRGSGGWSLTTAELRVLQFLPTHLSFPEIATRLYVSANTVKTHARAVYRKLDASSRGEAVVRARHAGLLDPRGEEAPAGLG